MQLLSVGVHLFDQLIVAALESLYLQVESLCLLIETVDLAHHVALLMLDLLLVLLVQDVLLLGVLLTAHLLLFDVLRLLEV